jgi:hypothetical protein
VRLNVAGAAVVVIAVLLVAGGMWAEIHLHEKPRWPALAVFAPGCLAALSLIVVVRRQSNLLTYGRPALATIRQVERKKSDNGTHWRAHYEWRLLSGATRTGRYDHHRKPPPAVGAVIPIVYDRDRPERHSRYPLPLVRL